MLNDARDWKNSGYIADAPHSKTGASALHVAAAKGYMKVMNLLIQAGMEVNIQDYDGWTPMHAAARSGFTDAALELLKAVEPATQRASALQRELERSAGFEAERVAKQLREVTGQSARLCEKALHSHSDDMQRAADWLLSQGEPKE